MTREDEDGFLIPAPIQTDMFAVDGGFTMPWIRWFQQFRKRQRVPSMLLGQIKLPGVQIVRTDALDAPAVVRLPEGIGARVYTVYARCFDPPATTAAEYEVTWRAAPTDAYTSIFAPGVTLTIPVGEYEATPIEPIVTDFTSSDDFNVNVIAADGTCSGVAIDLRGIYRLR